MGNNNKDSYQLLSMYTSDSASETPELVISPKKKRLKRKHRNITRAALHRGSAPATDFRCPGCGGCVTSTTTRLLIASITSAILICWIITLTYLAFVLNSEIQRLDNNVQRGLDAIFRHEA